MRKPIRIGVDLRNLKKAKTGTYTYIKEISEALKQCQSEDQQLVFFTYPLPAYTGKNYLLKITEHLLDFFWIQVALPFLCFVCRCNVLLCTDYFSPIICPDTKRVVVFHDCLFFDHSQYYNRIWLWYFRTLGLLGAKKSNAIVVPSQYVKDRLTEKMPIFKNKIVVVYEGCRNFMTEEPLENEVYHEWRTVSNFVQKRKFVLYVGTLDKRKNLDRLIQAWQDWPASKRRNLCLIVAGASPTYRGSNHTAALKRQVIIAELERSVHFTGRVSESTLKKLYENALFLVQPSLDEGFGLTIAEAMTFGLPFIAANNTALPEIGGTAGIYVDPLNVTDIRDAMMRLFSDSELRKKLIENGKQVRSRFQWNQTAVAFMEIFRSIHSAK